MRQLIVNGTTVDAIVRGKSIDAPETKTNIVELEGANGALDLSTVLTEGNPVYKNRDVSFDVAFVGADFFEVQSLWANLYHGRVLELTTDDQPDTYYIGRCSVDGWKEERGYIAATISLDADPFRYAVDETVIVVTASEGAGTPVTLENGRKWLVPLITPSAPLELVRGATVYALQAGAQRVAGIILRDTDTELLVRGAGTCEFRYRKGWL